MNNEVWKDIEGYEGLYQISNAGKVKSLPRKTKSRFGFKTSPGRMLNPSPRGKKGYMGLSLCKNGKSTSYSLHRLIALAFIPNPDNKPYINHIDHNKLNNSLENLEWCTPSENTVHAVKANKIYFLKGEERHNTKLSEDQVKEIRKYYMHGVYGHGIQAIARKYNLSTTTIRYLITGKTWKHI